MNRERQNAFHVGGAVFDNTEVNPGGGGPSRLALHEDASAMLPDNAVNGRETKAGAPAHFLSGEEGFENFVQSAGVHTHASVGNRKQNIFACIELAERD